MAKSKNRVIADIISTSTGLVREELLPSFGEVLVYTEALSGLTYFLDLSQNNIDKIISYRVLDNDGDEAEVSPRISSSEFSLDSALDLTGLTLEIYYTAP